MKRCWFGAGVLLLLLLVGLATGRYLTRTGQELSRRVERGARIREADPARGQEILTGAREAWRRQRLLMRILSDHGPITEADTLFDLLLADPEADSFRENALRLSRILSCLGTSQQPTLENIF
jgi:hypothetical protein